MSAEIVVGPSARSDMAGIVQFLSVDNPVVGERFVEQTQHTLALLAEAPGIGRPRDFDNPHLKGLRSWPVRGFRSYLIFYRPTEAGIAVLRVLHGARDLESILEEWAP